MNPSTGRTPHYDPAIGFGIAEDDGRVQVFASPVNPDTVFDVLESAYLFALLD